MNSMANSQIDIKRLSFPTADAQLLLGLKGDKGDTGAKGDKGDTGDTGNGIASITHTGTSGAVKTYTITFTDGTSQTYDVTDGQVTTEQMDTAIDNAVTDVKSDLNGSVCEYIPFTIVENSYINKNTGEFISYNGWDRTDYIEVDVTKDITIGASARTTYCASYDENHDFVYAFTLEAGENKISLPYNVKYIAVSGGQTIFPIWFKYEIAQDYFSELETVTNVVKPIGVLPFGGWHQGVLSDGAMSASWKRITSDYIAVDSGATYKITFSNSDFAISIAEYESDKTYIDQGSYINADSVFSASSNTAYIRVVALKRDDSYITPSDSLSLGISIKKVVTSSLKVMTYNMGHYNYGTGVGLPSSIYDEKLINYRRFFGEQNCDIVGIQEYDTRMDEANTIWADDVLWDYYYPYEQTTGSHTALKTKLPLVNSKYDQLSTGRYYCEGWLNGIYVLSVHLSVGTQNTQTRLDEADEIIANLLDGKETFIMFGDFNPEPSEEDALYKKFTDEGYNIANCGWFGKYYSWSNNRADFDNYDHPTGTKLYYLDNIIVSSNIKINNVYPLPSAYSKLSSDHIPIVAELSIEN